MNKEYNFSIIPISQTPSLFLSPFKFLFLQKVSYFLTSIFHLNFEKATDIFIGKLDIYLFIYF